MQTSLPAAVEALLRDTPGISLDEMQASAALTTRMDRKYVLDWDTLTAVLRVLAETHRVLEIDGRRLFRYESVYFDSPELHAFHAHLQRRRRRYKVRTRLYVDSGLLMFEVKLKGKRGETIKHRMPYEADDLGQLNTDARQFVCDLLAEAYPRLEVPGLTATLHSSYQRLTLTAGAERVTCDFDVTFGAADDAPGLDGRFVILESKCEQGVGVVDRELRRLGVHPVACSKYCLGLGLLRDDVKVNDMRWLLNRYFRAAPADPATPIASV